MPKYFLIAFFIFFSFKSNAQAPVEKLCSKFVFPTHLGKIESEKDSSAFYALGLIKKEKKNFFNQSSIFNLYKITPAQNQSTLLGSFSSADPSPLFFVSKNTLQTISFDPKKSLCFQGDAIITTYDIKADKKIQEASKEIVKNFAIVFSDKGSVSIDLGKSLIPAQKELETSSELKNIQGMIVYLSFSNKTFYELDEEKNEVILVQKKWTGEVIKNLHTFGTNESLTFAANIPYLLKYNLKGRILSVWPIENKTDKELFLVKISKQILLHDHQVAISPQKPFIASFSPLSQRRKKQDRQLSLIEPPYGAILASTSLKLDRYAGFSAMYEPAHIWLIEERSLKDDTTQSILLYDYIQRKWLQTISIK